MDTVDCYRASYAATTTQSESKLHQNSQNAFLLPLHHPSPLSPAKHPANGLENSINEFNFFFRYFLTYINKMIAKSRVPRLPPHLHY